MKRHERGIPHRGAAGSCLALVLLAATCAAAQGCGPKGNGERRPSDGRIPGCLDDEGIDLFAVEGDSVIGLAWNNNTGRDAAGGYVVRYGSDPGDLNRSSSSGCTDASCEHTLTGLENGVRLHLEVDALDDRDQVFASSCRVSATPNPLSFEPELRVHTSGTSQARPAIIGAAGGQPVFVAWEEGGAVYWSRSQDLGESWSPAEALPGASSNAGRPRLSFLDRSQEEEPKPSLLFAAFVSGGDVHVTTGWLDEGLGGPLSFEDPVRIGPGEVPVVAAAPGLVIVAYENGGGIQVVRSTDEGASFSAPARVDRGGGATSHAPSVAVNRTTGEVFVAYHGRRGSGDDDVYLVRSSNGGQTFSDQETRIDDDTGGANQRFVSIAVDARSGVVSATWEDRRGGANVFFAQSEDRGQTFSANVRTGAGLGGDQFTPRAVIDAGRNVYVLFIDTSSGRRPLFSRLNPEGTFDPPLEVSSEAGRAGAAANDPAVFVDRFGTVFAVWSENRQGQDTAIFFARAE